MLQWAPIIIEEWIVIHTTIVDKLIIFNHKNNKNLFRITSQLTRLAKSDIFTLCGKKKVHVVIRPQNCCNSIIQIHQRQTKL